MKMKTIGAVLILVCLVVGGCGDSDPTAEEFRGFVDRQIEALREDRDVKSVSLVEYDVVKTDSIKTPFRGTATIEELTAVALPSFEEKDTYKMKPVEMNYRNEVSFDWDRKLGKWVGVSLLEISKTKRNESQETIVEAIGADRIKK